MHGTTSSVGTTGRLSGPAPGDITAEVEPAWRPWVRLLEVAWRAADDPAWDRAVPEPVAARPLHAPLLEGAVVHVDARRVRRLVRDLLHEAERSDGERESPRAPPPRRRLDALAVLRGGITQDDDVLGSVAAAAGVDAGRLAVVAHLAATPLLRACAERFRDRIDPGWMRGYCPVCGAWPVLAELRGLERNRRLRCGRCASDWALPVLHCPYCDELHHERLRSLLPEGHEQTRRVDTCDTCKGYIKAFSGLQPMPFRALVAADLASVELDIVAQERGYARPVHAAHALSIALERATTARATTPRPAAEP